MQAGGFQRRMGTSARPPPAIGSGGSSEAGRGDRRKNAAHSGHDNPAAAHPGTTVMRGPSTPGMVRATRPPSAVAALGVCRSEAKNWK